MSYDIYAYKSKNTKPNAEEAQDFINLQNTPPVESSKDEKEAIASALMKENPKLERFKFDYDEISKSQNISVDEAKKQFNNIELTTPENDLPFQFIIDNDGLTISMPYWYNDESRVNDLFQSAKRYLKTVYNTASYHIYDPQTEQVCLPEGFDVEKSKQKYLKGVDIVQSSASQMISDNAKKDKIKKFGKYLIIILVIIVLKYLFS